ncbi:hypothetical protein TNCV_668931 [Trichonephila clavipes]|nr:hypothetical protein TNCV_668931 [Trichonephila clavipes]
MPSTMESYFALCAQGQRQKTTLQFSCDLAVVSEQKFTIRIDPGGFKIAHLSGMFGRVWETQFLSVAPLPGSPPKNSRLWLARIVLWKILHRPNKYNGVHNSKQYGDRDSLLVKVTYSCPACHEFEPSITEDPPFKRAMHIKYDDTQTSFRSCVVEARRGHPRSLTMVQNYHFRCQKPSSS